MRTNRPEINPRPVIVRPGATPLSDGYCLIFEQGRNSDEALTARRLFWSIRFMPRVSYLPAGNLRYDVRECMGAFFCDEGRTPCRCHGFPCTVSSCEENPTT